MDPPQIPSKKPPTSPKPKPSSDYVALSPRSSTKEKPSSSRSPADIGSPYQGGANAGFVNPEKGKNASLYYQSLSKPLNSPFHENLNVLESWVDEQGTKVTVEEFVILRGALQDWQESYFRGLAGHYAKRIHIEMGEETEVRIESGSLHFMKGRSIHLDAKLTVSAGLQGTIKPRIRGLGHLWLEPTYNYYVRYPLDGDIIIEGGFFWAAQGTIEVKAKVISAKGSVIGDSNLIHTRLSGKGWVIFQIPVPECEIQKIQLDDEKLYMDPPRSVIFRPKSVKFSAEFAGKGVFQKAFNTAGEGVFRTYVGTGEVWILPTVSIYEKLAVAQSRMMHLGYAPR